MPKIIPTAEEFLKNFNRQEGHTFEQSVPEAMIEFTKQHVEAALKEASKAHLSIDMDEYAFDKMGEKILTEEAEEYNVNSILESYPLTNIK